MCLSDTEVAVAAADVAAAVVRARFRRLVAAADRQTHTALLEIIELQAREQHRT